MSVIRVEKTRDYTIMSNNHFKNKEMSLKAKGLLSMMLSLPDDWAYTVDGITALSKDGKESVMKALNELEEFGYLYRNQKREDGKFSVIEYVISELPYTEKPYTENPTLLNTNVLNTKESNTKRLKRNQQEMENMFTEFWEHYPKHKDKSRAMKSFEKINPSREQLDKMIKAVDQQSKSYQWMKDNGQFIPMPSTWLNQERWNDEVELHKFVDEDDKW